MSHEFPPDTGEDEQIIQPEAEPSDRTADATEHASSACGESDPPSEVFKNAPNIDVRVLEKRREPGRYIQRIDEMNAVLDTLNRAATLTVRVLTILILLQHLLFSG